MKSYVKFIDFDIWDIIANGPFIPTWIKDDDTTIVKPKEKLNRHKKERFKKNATALYICLLYTSDAADE